MKRPADFLPYSRQHIDAADVRAVTAALKSSHLTQGPRVEEFERALCAYTGAKYCVVLANGTAALHAAYAAAGFSAGDTVLVPPITFLATANAACFLGAHPGFVDVEPDTGNMSIEALSREAGKRKAKGVVPVHFAGHPCDMAAIQRTARRNGLVVIEDAAHALGASYKGRKIGDCRYSDMTVLSFHPVKSMTTAEGGAVTTNNKRFYEALVRFRQHGVTRDPRIFQDKGMKDAGWYYEMQSLGYNYRLTDVQCALGVSQMKKLDAFMASRRKTVGIYQRAFEGNECFDVPVERAYASSSWHLYPVRLKPRAALRKKQVFQALRKQGLGVQVHYIPVYHQPYYLARGFHKGMCPAAEDFYSRELSLPLFPFMTAEEKNRVIKSVDIIQKIIGR